MSAWLDRILYGMFPGRCILCKAGTGRHLDLCLACELDLPKITNACWQCGLSNSEGQEICPACLRVPPPFTHCFSAFKYAAPIDRLIHQFKNEQKILIGKVLALVLARMYLDQHLIVPDQWLPVPLHKERLKSRGFNQALEIVRKYVEERYPLAPVHNAESEYV